MLEKTYWLKNNNVCVNVCVCVCVCVCLHFIKVRFYFWNIVFDLYKQVAFSTL